MMTLRARRYARRALRAPGHKRRSDTTASTDDHRVHFLHIGKNAGSQVAAIARQINGQDNDVTIIKHGHNVFLRDIPKGDEYFFSIRNPVSRFVSGFYSRKRKGRPKFNSEWSPYEAKAFADFDHANDLAEALFAEGPLGVRAFGAIKSIQHTAQNQVDWFYGCGNIFAVRPPVWVIRQEAFEEDIEVLCRRLGIGAGIRIEPDPVRSHKGDYSGTPELSERAVENLKSWYVQDFEFYRACEDWISSVDVTQPRSASDL